MIVFGTDLDAALTLRLVAVGKALAVVGGGGLGGAVAGDVRYGLALGLPAGLAVLSREWPRPSRRR